jgi:hypothetical protein
LAAFTAELYTIFTSTLKLLHRGEVEFFNPGTGPALKLRSDAGDVNFSNRFAVPIIGIVTAVGASNTYTVDLYELGVDDDATEEDVTVTRLVPPAGSYSVGDHILVLRLPDGVNSSGEPAWVYYSLSRIA